MHFWDTPPKTHAHTLKAPESANGSEVCHRSVSWPPPRDLMPQETKQSWRNTPQSSNSLGDTWRHGVCVSVCIGGDPSIRLAWDHYWTRCERVKQECVWIDCGVSVKEIGVWTSGTERRTDEDVSISFSDRQTAPCPLWESWILNNQHTHTHTHTDVQACPLTRYCKLNSQHVRTKLI